MYILIFLLVLGVVVLIHELGHFLFARRAGILCHEFSIGMGPALFKFKKGETTYAIRAIPIGGYVSAAGEEPETSKIKKNQVVYLKIANNYVQKIYLNEPLDGDAVKVRIIDFDLYGKEGQPLYIQYEGDDGTHYVNVARDCMYVYGPDSQIQIAPYDRCYESKPWLSRFLFVSMGAGFNFILATVIFIVINLVTGIPTNEPVMVDPITETPAELAGFQEGDRIISLNGESINEWDDISNYMTEFTGGEITVVIKRDGEEITRTITPLVTINTIGVRSNKDVLTDTVIGSVSYNSKADKEGLEEGDAIRKVNGVAVSNWTQIQEEFSKYYLGQEISLTYTRDGIQKTINITTLKALEPENVASHSIGISPVYEFKFFESITQGVKQTFQTIASVFQTLDLLFNEENVGVSDLSGPVGIYDMTKTFAMSGFISLLAWMAFISANIGFVNLLPLPALDGGRLIFLLIEGVTRKPVNRKVEGYIHMVGFILFMMLFLYITFNDVIRLGG